MKMKWIRNGVELYEMASGIEVMLTSFLELVYTETANIDRGSPLLTQQCWGYDSNILLGKKIEKGKKN